MDLKRIFSKMVEPIMGFFDNRYIVKNEYHIEITEQHLDLAKRGYEVTDDFDCHDSSIWDVEIVSDDKALELIAQFEKEIIDCQNNITVTKEKAKIRRALVCAN